MKRGDSINVARNRTVRCAYIMAAEPTVIALCVDLEERCTIGCVGSDEAVPMIGLERGDGTMVEVTLSEFEGWFVFCAEVSKTVLSVCLTKEV